MTIARDIQKTLVDQIVAGTLRPGHKLEEKALASAFGVSRTPIREALRELDIRGLIELRSRRGYVVAQLGGPQLADMLDAECEMEALCARLAASRMTAIEKSVLEALHHQTTSFVSDKNEKAYRHRNQRFHNLICEGAHSATLTGITQGLRVRLAPFRQSPTSDGTGRIEQSHTEHAAIVNAILQNDPNTAYTAMQKHNARISSGILSVRDSDAKRSNSDSPPPLYNAVAPPPRKRRVKNRSVRG